MKMDSASFEFVLFGVAVALVSNISSSRVWRSTVLLVASIVFLALLANHLPVFLPLAGFLLLGYTGLVVRERGWSKATFWSILTIIFAYIWLKKYTFLPPGMFIHASYFTLGLSYILFRVLHLLIEAGDRGGKRPIGFGAYLLYTLNLTTFVSARHRTAVRTYYPRPLQGQRIGYAVQHGASRRACTDVPASAA
jgi:hypothetical protein